MPINDAKVYICQQCGQITEASNEFTNTKYWECGWCKTKEHLIECNMSWDYYIANCFDADAGKIFPSKMGFFELFDDYAYKYFNENPPPEFYKRVKHFKDEQAIYEVEHANDVVVECPYCHSTNTQKISALSKAGSAWLFGLFSLGKISKQWHCNNCGSDF